jgi:hypothetical protein
MIEATIARETVPCFRCGGGGCPRCGGKGERPAKRCAGCDEPGGSVSAVTGAPLVGRKGGKLFHVTCKPGRAATVMLAAL